MEPLLQEPNEHLDVDRLEVEQQMKVDELSIEVNEQPGSQVRTTGR